MHACTLLTNEHACAHTQLTLHLADACLPTLVAALHEAIIAGVDGRALATPATKKKQLNVIVAVLLDEFIESVEQQKRQVGVLSLSVVCVRYCKCIFVCALFFQHTSGEASGRRKEYRCVSACVCLCYTSAAQSSFNCGRISRTRRSTSLSTSRFEVE